MAMCPVQGQGGECINSALSTASSQMFPYYYFRSNLNAHTAAPKDVYLFIKYRDAIELAYGICKRIMSGDKHSDIFFAHPVVASQDIPCPVQSSPAPQRDGWGARQGAIAADFPSIGSEPSHDLSRKEGIKPLCEQGESTGQAFVFYLTCKPCTRSFCKHSPKQVYTL